MMGIGPTELLIVTLVVGAPVLIGLRNFAPRARAVPAITITEMDMVREWASVRGAWRDGDLMVVGSGAVLPDRCVMTNQPQAARLSVDVVWHPAALYLAVLASIWLYAVLALLLRRRVNVELGVSQEVMERRRNMNYTAVGLAATCGVLVVTLPLTDSSLGALAAAAAALTAVGAWFRGRRLVRPVRIEGDYAWIAGAHPDFVMTLPAWQGAG